MLDHVISQGFVTSAWLLGNLAPYNLRQQNDVYVPLRPILLFISIQKEHVYTFHSLMITNNVRIFDNFYQSSFIATLDLSRLIQITDDATACLTYLTSF